MAAVDELHEVRGLAAALAEEREAAEHASRYYAAVTLAAVTTPSRAAETAEGRR